MSRDQLGSRVEYGTFSEEVKDDFGTEIGPKKKC